MREVIAKSTLRLVALYQYGDARRVGDCVVHFGIAPMDSHGTSSTDYEENAPAPFCTGVRRPWNEVIHSYSSIRYLIEEDKASHFCGQCLFWLHHHQGAVK